MNTAERLKQARKERGYTQEALARAIGVSRGVISNIEYEKVVPSPLVIRAICETLRINESWLLSGKGTMDNNTAVEKSAKVLAEIYDSARRLSEEEQEYILDMIRTFRKHKEHMSEPGEKDG